MGILPDACYYRGCSFEKDRELNYYRDYNNQKTIVLRKTKK